MSYINESDLIRLLQSDVILQKQVFYKVHIAFQNKVQYEIEYAFGYFVSAVLAISSPSFLTISCPTHSGMQSMKQTPLHSAVSAQQQTKHWWVMLVQTQSQNSTPWALMKKINSIPARTIIFINRENNQPSHSKFVIIACS